MIATLAIELCLVAYAIFRYKLNMVGRLTVALLVFLALFQLAEFNVCTGGSDSDVMWSRIGFAAISTLPPLGLHLMYVLAKNPGRKMVYGAYAAMALFIGYFLLYESVFAGQQCTGNYVIFQLTEYAGGWYSVYYFGLLLVAIVQGFRWVEQHKSADKLNVRQIQAIKGLIAGYLVFLVPTAIASTVNPETRGGIPSIMCGFAVLLAIILVFHILPRAGQLRSGEKTKTIKQQSGSK